jgi:hypothetical protein
MGEVVKYLWVKEREIEGELIRQKLIEQKLIEQNRMVA